MTEEGVVEAADFSNVRKEDIRIPTRDGTSIRAVHYRPESSPPRPLLVYYFGGGWSFGWPEFKDLSFEKLIKELGFTVVAVDYRVAPECVFPKAAEDAWDSLEWAAKNASGLGADPSQGLIVWGTSAGGNLAAVVSHQAVDSKLSPPVTGVFLEIPLLVHPDAVPEQYKAYYNSYEDLRDMFILSRRDLNYFFDQYKPDPKSPLFSSLLWPTGHKNQPPTYFQLCGRDPLRDDGLIYEHLLSEECGVPTRLDMYQGVPHGAMDFIPTLSASKRASRDRMAGIKWLLDHNIRGKGIRPRTNYI
ncbi:alpha/beta-hydrolase [Corynespora cassiicola Philippines]|uniref:Alpha/beta-hydrolase n=1 Tax=Corynespora cassiicola Philippines TaxID=1448308 RepID=A0A2T2NWB0_CORCC|nr:alpha/beta-hydrolase [Corynespora cassiicola Philippines]